MHSFIYVYSICGMCIFCVFHKKDLVAWNTITRVWNARVWPNCREALARNEWLRNMAVDGGGDWRGRSGGSSYGGDETAMSGGR